MAAFLCPQDLPFVLIIRGAHMRLTAAHAVRPINREASQAERRRFESGQPLYSQALNLGQRRIGPEKLA